MIVSVDPASPVPVFEQLRAQIQRLIVSGALRPGATLPPIRQLATDLGLARGTVNKVYDALAREGLVRTNGRHGTVVLEPHETTATRDDLADAAAALALVARQLGVRPAEAHAALTAALQRLAGPPPPPPA